MKRIGKTYLLDTNIIVDLFGGDVAIKKKLSAESIMIPSVVIGELYYGAYLSSRKKSRLLEIDEFISNYEVIHVNQETAQFLVR